MKTMNISIAALIIMVLTNVSHAGVFGSNKGVVGEPMKFKIKPFTNNVTVQYDSGNVYVNNDTITIIPRIEKISQFIVTENGVSKRYSVQAECKKYHRVGVIGQSNARDLIINGNMVKNLMGGCVKTHILSKGGQNIKALIGNYSEENNTYSSQLYRDFTASIGPNEKLDLIIFSQGENNTTYCTKPECTSADQLAKEWAPLTEKFLKHVAVKFGVNGVDTKIYMVNLHSMSTENPIEAEYLNKENQNGLPFWNDIKTQQQIMCDTVLSNCDLINTDGLEMHGDRVHFKTSGYVKMLKIISRSYISEYK